MEITEVAKNKITQLITQSAQDFPQSSPYLRVSVSAGGCSGLRYQTYFDDKEIEGDEITNYGTFELRIDKYSVAYLLGAKMDYIESMDKIGFTIDNPNASNACACGDSFS